MPCSGIGRSVRKLATWPRAWTPASVRDAPTTRVSCCSSCASAASRWPCTVGPFVCRCQPDSAVPSYSTTSLIWRTGPVLTTRVLEFEVDAGEPGQRAQRQLLLAAEPVHRRLLHPGVAPAVLGPAVAHRPRRLGVDALGADRDPERALEAEAGAGGLVSLAAFIPRRAAVGEDARKVSGRCGHPPHVI